MDHKLEDEYSSDDKREQSQNERFEATVWRKMDIYVVPIVTMYYLLSFLVRAAVYFPWPTTNS